MIKTSRFDPAEYLLDRRDQAELWNDALASGDDAYIDHALAVISRARKLAGVDSELMGAVSLSRAFAHQEPFMRAA